MTRAAMLRLLLDALSRLERYADEADMLFVEETRKLLAKSEISSGGA